MLTLMPLIFAMLLPPCHGCDAARRDAILLPLRCHAAFRFTLLPAFTLPCHTDADADAIFSLLFSPCLLMLAADMLPYAAAAIAILRQRRHFRRDFHVSFISALSISAI